MSISIILPLFLLIIGGITLWILIESNVHWVFKIISTITLCFFTIILFFTLQTFFGWPSESEMPEKVAIKAVIIKEPNNNLHFKGRIYITLDSVKSKYDNKLLQMFGYKTEKLEPKLFSVPYNRQLHEALERDVIPKLKDGQTVYGKMKKNAHGGNGKGNNNGKNGEPGKGGGSESQSQDFMFYNLTPGEIQPKTPNGTEEK